MTMINLYLIIILAPLVGSIIVGFLGTLIGKKFSHRIAILGILISTIVSYLVLYQVEIGHINYDGTLYTWINLGGINCSIGILIDGLSAVMLTIVTTVSLMVHIYTIGYMQQEEGYQRFFSYISLFSFMMIILVVANNFIQLFFAWEGVGLVSYLLIGFYYKRPAAIFANLKAFLINRIGDFGFLLGIALIYTYCGTLNYGAVFNQIDKISTITLFATNWHLSTVICILLFVGAMGKSAQFPLHVWLPDSMEGPTPISALIHAATMVTAGIFMVARFSPLYNLSPTASSLIMIIGGINALFLGILGIIQNDIKRVIAYSTLSQLGYMVVALGCGAYSIAIFHLMTHAFFKGLLFLAAGSVIVALHHQQDMRNMGGLAKYMPITYITMLIGSLALTAIPPFAGFFSKDMILEAALVAYHGGLYGGWFAVFSTYSSVIVTAIYTFRLLFMTFHGTEHFKHNNSNHETHDTHSSSKPQESPWVITFPLIMLAIPSAIIGYLGFKGFLSNSLFSNAVFNSPLINSQISVKALAGELTPLKMMLDSFSEPPLYLALAGIFLAWLLQYKPNLIRYLTQAMHPLYFILERKYFMDDLYINFLAPRGRELAKLLAIFGDTFLIDGLVVNGSAKIVGIISTIVRKIQTGYVNSYATFMVLGILILLTLSSKLFFNYAWMSI